MTAYDLALALIRQRVCEMLALPNEQLPGKAIQLGADLDRLERAAWMVREAEASR